MRLSQLLLACLCLCLLADGAVARVPGRKTHTQRKRTLKAVPKPSGYSEVKLQRLLDQGQTQAAIELLERYLKQNPSALAQRLRLAQLVQRYGDAGYALLLFDQVTERDPSRSSAYLKIAEILTELKRYSEAIAALRRGMAQTTGFARKALWLQRAILTFHYGESDDAMPMLKQLLARFPGESKAHLYLGHASYDAHRYRQAATHYEAVLRFGGYYNRAYVKTLLIQVYIRLYRQAGDRGQIEAARDYQQKYMAFLLPLTRRKPASAQGHLRLGNIYSSLGDQRRALQHYREAVALEPDYQTALNNLSWLLVTTPDLRQRKPRLAVRYAERCMELNRWRQANYVDTLAEAYFQNHQPVKALRTLNEASLIDPLSAYYRRQLTRFRSAHLGYEPGSSDRLHLRIVRPSAEIDP